jgi:hypothetical protein
VILEHFRGLSTIISGRLVRYLGHLTPDGFSNKPAAWPTTAYSTHQLCNIVFSGNRGMGNFGFVLAIMWLQLQHRFELL